MVRHPAEDLGNPPGRIILAPERPAIQCLPDLPVARVPLARRKTLLVDALFPSDVVRPVEHVDGEGVAAYEAAGCDYLVLNLRRAPSAAALERSLEEVVDILN